MGKATEEWRVGLVGAAIATAATQTYGVTGASTFFTLVDRIKSSLRKHGKDLAMRVESLDSFVALLGHAADDFAESHGEHKVRGFANQMRALHKKATSK